MTKGMLLISNIFHFRPAPPALVTAIQACCDFRPRRPGPPSWPGILPLIEVSSWHPYCFPSDWLTSDINCHLASLSGTYGKGLTARDYKVVSSVECKVVKITQPGVSSICFSCRRPASGVVKTEIENPGNDMWAKP